LICFFDYTTERKAEEKSTSVRRLEGKLAEDERLRSMVVEIEEGIMKI